MNVSDLAAAISSELESYSREVDQKMQKEVDAISKEIVKELKNNPDIPVRTGNYKKSFVVTLIFLIFIIIFLSCFFVVKLI